MNLLLLAGVALGMVAWLWIAQALALVSEGQRRIWVLPFRHPHESHRIRAALKLALGSGLIAAILFYPWVIGQDPLRYHGEKFSFIHWGLSLQAPLLVCGILTLL